MCFPFQTGLKYKIYIYIYMKQLMDANCAMFTYARLVINLFMIGNRNTNYLLTFTHLSLWNLEPLYICSVVLDN